MSNTSHSWKCSDKLKADGFFTSMFGISDSELRRFWYSAIYISVTLYFVGVCNVATEKRAQKMTISGPLPDTGFHVLQSFTDILYRFDPGLQDRITPIIIIGTILWILLRPFEWKSIMDRCHKWNDSNESTVQNTNGNVSAIVQRVTLLKRYFTLLATIYGIRCFTEMSTLFPRPWPDEIEWKSCPYENYQWGNPFIEAVYIGMGRRFVCHDLFFSGHTSNVVLCGLIVQKYCQYWFLKLIWWALISFNVLLLIANRLHYTIDVEAALIIVILLWTVFDYQIEYRRGLFSLIEKPEFTPVAAHNTNRNNRSFDKTINTDLSDMNDNKSDEIALCNVESSHIITLNE